MYNTTCGILIFKFLEIKLVRYLLVFLLFFFCVNASKYDINKLNHNQLGFEADLLRQTCRRNCEQHKYNALTCETLRRKCNSAIIDYFKADEWYQQIAENPSNFDVLKQYTRYKVKIIRQMNEINDIVNSYSDKTEIW